MDNSASAHDSSGYTVVARRYRPRSFSELIGQDHIAHALHTAIASGRVGHAYLFTGARGVGKTSSARIFAKALNANDEMEPALAADISQAIDAGEDMDVIEIDGASNRGIEEIRQLRANVHVRPSRSRFKIYIIDEVHMLTNQAFNALLKTLEEPPPHVKFIFCTTDPDKLPITVLSRCQRFDFVPIKLDAIQQRLREIADSEGYEADEDALALLARRAAGSMRDSQSLLEQVMSFSQGKISLEQVQQLLGIADEGRLQAITRALADCNALQVICLVDQAAQEGADAGQLAEQLLNYLRDLMAVGIGGGPELLKLANPAGHGQLKELVTHWGTQSILSAIQILDESLVRMRSSVSASALLEVALVQICQLPQLASIPALLEAVLEGTPGRGTGPVAPRPAQVSAQPTAAATTTALPSAPPMSAATRSEAASEPRAASTSDETAEKKKLQAAEVASSSAPPRQPEPAPVQQPESSRPPQPADQSAPPQPASAASASPRGAGHSPEAFELWRSALTGISDMLADYAGLAVAVVPGGSDQWNIVFPPGIVRPKDICEQPERRHLLEQSIEKVAHRKIRLSFSVMPGEAPRTTQVSQPANSRVQKIREIAENPYVKKLCEVIDGEILRVDAAPSASLALRAPHTKNSPTTGA